MNDHEVATARDQLRQLVARYNNAADRGRIAEFSELFAPDGVLQLSHETLEGVDAIIGALSFIASGKRPDVNLIASRHHLTTTRIDVLDQDHAQGWIYFFVSRRGVIIEEGTYIDRYVRLDAGWRIAHRRVKMLYTVHRQDVPVQGD